MKYIYVLFTKAGDPDNARLAFPYLNMAKNWIKGNTGYSTKKTWSIVRMPSDVRGMSLEEFQKYHKVWRLSGKTWHVATQEEE